MMVLNRLKNSIKWIQDYWLDLLLFILMMLIILALFLAWHTGLLFPGPWVLIHLNNSTIT